MFGMAAWGCTHSRKVSTQPRPTVAHVVVCWLKTPGNAHDREALIKASRDFEGKIPGLLHVSAGAVLPSTRPAVDSSFDVAIVMTFASESALIEYGRSAAHQQAVRDVLKPLVQRYVVYDFSDQDR
jgi:hypothetical protein